MKRLLFLILALVAAALILAAVILFLPPAFQAALRSANRFLPVTVNVAEYRHTPGRLVLSGVRVEAPRGASCEISRLGIEYRPLRLVFGKIEISALEIESPRISVRRSAEGQLNLFEPSTRPEGEKEEEDTEDAGSWTAALAPLHIREIRLEEGTVRFEDLASGLSLAWGSVQMEGNLSGHPLQAEATLSRGSLEASRGAPSPIRIATEGRVSLSDGTVRLSALRLSTEESSVSAEGRYSLSDGKADVTAELRGLRLERILASFGVTGVRVEELGGTLEAETDEEGGTLLRADLEGTAYGHEAGASLSGRLTEERFRLKSLVLGIPEATLTGEADWERETGKWDGRFDLSSPVLEDFLHRHGVTDTSIRGLRVDGTFRGTPQDPEVGFGIRLDEVSHRGPLLVSGFTAQGGFTSSRGVYLSGQAETVHALGEAGRAVQISASLDKGVAQAELRADPALDLRGRFELRNRHAELALKARQFSLSLPLEDRIPCEASLSLTGEGNFRGVLDERETWKGEAEIESLRFSLPDLTVRTARPAKVGVERGRLEGSAELEANGGKLTVRGSYPLEGEGNVRLELDGSLALEDFRMAARSFVPVLDGLKGDLQVRGTLQGPVEAPRLEAKVKLSEGSIRIVPPAEGDERERPVNGTESAEGAEEGARPREILAGRILLDLELSGSLESPSGSLDARLREGTLYGEGLDEVHLQAASPDGRLWKPQLLIRRGDDQLTFTGSWQVPSGQIGGEVRSTELDLATFLPGVTTPVEGQGRLQGTIEGTVQSPRVHLQADLKSLSMQGTPLGDIDADLTYERDRISIQAKMDSGHFETTVNLSGRREFSFEGSLKGFAVGPILNRAGLRGWTGRVSLAGQLAGPLTDFESWKGEISLDEMDLAAGGVPVRLGGPVLLDFDKGRLTVPDCTLVVEDSRLHVEGTVGSESRLTLEGTLSLQPFAPLIPWVRFDSARVETDLIIRGSLSAPQMEGTLRLEAGEVKLGGLAYPVETLQADLRAEANRFTLLSLKARVSDGEVRASGTVTISPLSFEDVNLVLDAVPVRFSDDLAARVRGDLVLQGTRESSRLQGRLRIIEARYEEDFDLAGMVLRPTRPAQRRVKAADPFRKNMRLDVNIKSGPDLIIRNNIARVILSTDMDIRGTAANPVPLGIVKVEEGRVYFSKKRFDITQGALSFIDPQGGTPKLQLESKVEVQGTTRQYTIYLTFSGPLDRIQLELRSVPDLDREDIIFMLVTGKTRDEFYASSGKPADEEETAQRLAVSGLGMLIGGDVREMTGLDTFEMERTEGEAFGVKTTVGKRFNERLEVRGVFALGSGQQASEAQVGYLLTDMFYAVGTQRTDGSFGLDFRIRIKCR